MKILCQTSYCQCSWVCFSVSFNSQLANNEPYTNKNTLKTCSEELFLFFTSLALTHTNALSHTRINPCVQRNRSQTNAAPARRTFCQTVCLSPSQTAGRTTLRLPWGKSFAVYRFTTWLECVSEKEDEQHRSLTCKVFQTSTFQYVANSASMHWHCMCIL